MYPGSLSNPLCAHENKFSKTAILSERFNSHVQIATRKRCCEMAISILTELNKCGLSGAFSAVANIGFNAGFTAS